MTGCRERAGFGRPEEGGGGVGEGDRQGRGADRGQEGLD
jgi:hypothetical protein